MKLLAAVVLIASTLGGSLSAQFGRIAVALPDSAGVPTRALAIAESPAHELWVGTYGRGIFVRPSPTSAAVRQIVRKEGDSTSISLDFVHAIAFGNNGEVWYGTIGNGWGVSRDGGKTWRNWTFAQLGPEWQYVVPDGIVIHGDTVVIGTADGLQVTTDDGAHWVAFGDAVGPQAKGPADTVFEILGSEYVRSIKMQNGLWRVEQLRGITYFDLGACLRTAHHDARSRCEPSALSDLPGPGDKALAPAGLTPARTMVAGSAKNWAPLFARPISQSDNDRPDQTYRWGSTMGGFFQPHQGIEFNNPDGTPVHAVGGGVVVYAGRAEQGALTVGIRHDTMLVVNGKPHYLFSVYYHNSALLVHVGDRVKRGDVISRVGHTGRATNDHMHLEVHIAPTDSVKLIIDSLNRYPVYTTNPELSITPIPGTGVVAGTVVDSAGHAILQARVYGIEKPMPRETPYVYAETYGPRNRPHPLYGEQFAVSDVPAGTYRMFVIINGKRIERTVTVKAGALTWVEFKP